MHSNYSPFSKSFEDILADDLVALRTVHEGWYVEYKASVPNAPAIAKSVSAFANTYGGFLFYGIKEESKENNVAGEFIGIETDEIEPMRERIRQAICAHSAPEPHFDIKVWNGPNELLALTKNRSIICVHIPRSSRAPHIHKSGVIYRRVADSSEPTPENDRHALGELFKRSEKLLSTYRSWYEADPDLYHENEKAQPYLRLLIAFDPWRERDPWLPLTTPEIRNLFNPTDKTATLPFDAIHSTSDGVIARQVKGNTLNSLTMTWALRRDLTSEIIIPIPWAKITANQGSEIKLDGYEQKDRFAKIIKAQKHSELKILDINQLYHVFIGIFEVIDRLANETDWKNPIFATFKILNAERACPFLDIGKIIERYEAHGVPVIFNLMSPLNNHHHPDSFFEFSSVKESDADQLPTINAAVLLMHLARSCGVPIWEDESDSDLELDLVGELHRAGLRSMKAQSIRNQALAEDSE